MKVFFYCQYVLGIGHFFRSFEIAKALAPNRVLFIEGGQPFLTVPCPSHVTRLFLPPLMMDETFEKFNLEGEELLRVQNDRKEKLIKAYEEFLPDVVIIELFPFGRKKFSFELIPLLEKISADKRKTLVVCSLRDILVEKKNRESYESWVLRHLNNFFHALLIHADERVMRLEESFSRTSEISIPVYYTGFVARRPAKRKITANRPKEVKKIAVSTGGGKVGGELIEGTILAVREIKNPHLEVEIYIGPFMDETMRKHLKKTAESDNRVQFRDFTPDFVEVLAGVDISISMAGYNTLMDILTAGTYGILYPFRQNREQRLRAEKLARFGNFAIIDEAKPEIIRREIELALSCIPSTKSRRISGQALNLMGADITKTIIERELSHRGFSIH